MSILRGSQIPRLLLRKNESPLILADAAAEPVTADDAGTKFTALGYRQTLVSAAKGGKPNSNGFRFRTGDMRALARTFRGNAFVSGHDWGDVRARAGTIEDAWAEELPGDLEMGMFYELVAQASWAKAGLQDGTIDRFSIGASPGTEITCTVHNVPIWSISECWCFPGETVLDEDGEEVVAEWEHDGSKGLELSAVNVPAVGGTGIVHSKMGSLMGRIEAFQRIEHTANLVAVGSTAERSALEQMCGRSKPWDRRPTGRVQVAVPAAQVGGSTPEIARPTMASQTNARNTMDRALICQLLGLPSDATDEQIKAKLAASGQSAAELKVAQTQLAEVAAREQSLVAERDNAHVESQIAKLRAARQVSDAVIEDLRAAAKTSRASFDSAYALVEKSAPPVLANSGGSAGLIPSATQLQQQLQSGQKPTPTPGNVTLEAGGDEGPDAYEANRTNPNLARYMRVAGITAEDVRKHGSRQFHVLPNLRELAENTEARGDRMGTGR